MVGWLFHYIRHSFKTLNCKHVPVLLLGHSYTSSQTTLNRPARAAGKGLTSDQARSNAIGLQILDVESQQADLLSASKPSSATLDEQLEKLYRENLRLCEDVQHIIEGSDNDMNLLDSIKILAGLREASEESLTARAASKPGRGAKKAEGEESAAPSPRVNLGQSNRLNVKEKSSRASSIPATREASVKIEDGVESVASSADGTSKSSDRPTNKMTLKMGEIVFYRNKGRAVEGEGILCKVTNVIGEGKQRRYEIQDVDTDPQPGTGEVPPPWRASVSNLMQIPESNRGLGDLAKGKAVLAQYPVCCPLFLLSSAC